MDYLAALLDGYLDLLDEADELDERMDALMTQIAIAMDAQGLLDPDSHDASLH